MIFLKCKICMGEVDLLENDYAINRKTKCRKCGFTNFPSEHAGPEVVIIKRRPVSFTS